MMQKQYIAYAVGVLFAGYTALQANLEFMAGGLPEFIAIHMPMEDQLGFNNYYQALTELLNTSDEQKQNNTFKYLYELALRDLKENHKDWFDHIQPLIQKKAQATPDRDQHRLDLANFLRRYGAYQEYQKNRTVLAARFAPEQALVAQIKTEEPGFWSTISSYVSKVTDTVAGWFGFNKTETVA